MSWARKTMEKFWKVLLLYLKHHSEMGCSLATLLTAGGELTFSTVVFQCPCSASWNLGYGLVCLLVPVLVLFLLGYLLNLHSLHLLIDCCRRRSRGQGQGRYVDCSTRCELCCRVSRVGAIVSFTWVAVALLDGHISACAASGITGVARLLCAGLNSSCADQLPLVPCQKAKEPDVQVLLRDLLAASQVLGWSVIAIIIILLLCFTCISQSRAADTHLLWKFWKIYSEQEQQILRKQITEHATQLAEENVKCFFENSTPKEFNIPSTEAWQQASSLCTFDRKSKYYSVLHEYVHKKGKRHDSCSPGGDEGAVLLSTEESPHMETSA